MNESSVRRLLAREFARAGSLRKWAAEHDFSPAYVSDVHNKKRALADNILAALGLERVVKHSVSYRRASPPPAKRKANPHGKTQD